MVNQELLNDTLQKINASLNKRFEKDADLYISRQDESDMKKHLCNGAYAAVVNMAKAKGISHDIAVKVLLRNASVINVTDFSRFEQELQPILQGADYSALEYMMEDVFSNNVYMQRKIRHILFYYYMSGISTEKRLWYWENERLSFDTHERNKLYDLILEKAEKTGPLKSLESKIEFMNGAFTRYPNIAKDKNAILKLIKQLDDDEKEQFFKYLSGEMQRPSIDSGEFALVNAYGSYGETAFNDAIGQIKSGSPSQYKQYIKVIRNLFEREQDKDSLVRMFDTLYRVFDSPYMKNHVKQEINRKIWPQAKARPALYEARRTQLDQLLSGFEKSDRKKYMSIADVVKDIEDNTNPKSIAYLWLNMPSPAFEKSIRASFAELNADEIRTVKEIYIWLFKNSWNWRGEETLTVLCEKVAAALHQSAKAGEQSIFFYELDRLWLGNVTRLKLRGKNIENYMFEAHFDKVKEWKQ